MQHISDKQKQKIMACLLKCIIYFVKIYFFGQIKSTPLNFLLAKNN